MRMFALADQDADFTADFSAELLQMRMRISAKSCGFGCGFQQSYADRNNAEFCIFLPVRMRTSANICILVQHAKFKKNSHIPDLQHP